jgi:hypothetical protein
MGTAVTKSQRLEFYCTSCSSLAHIISASGSQFLIDKLNFCLAHIISASGSQFLIDKLNFCLLNKLGSKMGKMVIYM